MKQLRRQHLPDPNQLSLLLDFSPDDSPIRAMPLPEQKHGRVLQPEHSAPPAILPLAPGKRRIWLQDQALDYRLLRSKRRSIGFLIDNDGLRITAPKWVTLAEIENAIREKQRWILSKLQERQERAVHRPQAPMQWCDGARLPYLGNEITLRIQTFPLTRPNLVYHADAQELTVYIPANATEQQVKKQVLLWLQVQAKTVFGQRLPVYAEKLGVRFHSYALSSAKTQWGCCTADGRIRLNWRLIHFALPLIDYVVAHEVSHLLEMNHSPRFWATVYSIYPDFQAAKKALRERGPDSLPIF